MFSNVFPTENRAVHEKNVEKDCRAGQATGDNMAHAPCMLDTMSANTHSEYAILLLFDCNNGCTNCVLFEVRTEVCVMQFSFNLSRCQNLFMPL